MHALRVNNDQKLAHNYVVGFSCHGDGGCKVTDNIAGEFTMKKISVWLVADLSTTQGRKILQNALSYLVSQFKLVLSLYVHMFYSLQLTTEHVQVGVVHTFECVISRSIVAALSMGWPMATSLKVIQNILTLDTGNLDIDTVVGVADALELKVSKFRAHIESSSVTSILQDHETLCSTVLKLSQGQNMLLSNGKVSSSCLR